MRDRLADVPDVNGVAGGSAVRFGASGIVHVHLGLYGTFTESPLPVLLPIGQVRMRMVGETHWTDLRGPTACEVLNKAEVKAIRDRLENVELPLTYRGMSSDERSRRLAGPSIIDVISKPARRIARRQRALRRLRADERVPATTAAPVRDAEHDGEG